MSRFFSWKKLHKSIASAAVAGMALGVLVGAPSAQAAMYLNEIFIDSPGAGDPDEYFEIRGISTDSLSNHYFIQLENEDTANNNPGIVDFAFSLGSYNFNSSNYLWFANSTHGYGTTPTATYSGNTMENSGGTFLLVNTTGAGTAPAVGDVWDTNLDGDFDTSADTNGTGKWNNSWSIVDAIGVFAEAADISGSGDGRLYADVNFAAGVFTGINTDGTSKALGGSAGTPANVDTNRAALDGATITEDPFRENSKLFGEIEYAGRYGDTTSKTDSLAWIAANATNNSASGYTTTNDLYGVSGNHAGLQDPEVVLGSNIASPHGYGHDLTGSLGSINSTSYTPEPASFVMLGMGGVALLSLARRRRG